jgi:glutamine cyclotransferase
LTWKSHIGFVYDKDSFKLLKTFQYPTEGWGITHDGKQLIMSDGSADLYFLNPETLKETGRIEVRDRNNLVTRLNELEYINGEIFANVWMTNRIARIDPQTGRVTGWINLDGLSPFRGRVERTRVLNGIAYDAKNDRLFVTGKLWPNLFEIKLVPAD